jgi:hypothetical protein
VDHPPAAVRLTTRIATKVRTAFALRFQGALYMHCGSLGQANCGGIPARWVAAFFKRLFEIGMTGKTAIVNQF